MPKGHRRTGLFLAEFGKTLLKLERFRDAEGALLEAHGILETALGKGHERRIEVIKSLIGLRESWDAAESGKGYAEKAAEWRVKLPKEVSIEDN